MRKAITMIVVLALGVSLWAESSPTRPSKNDVEIRFQTIDHQTTVQRHMSCTWSIPMVMAGMARPLHYL